MRRLTGFRLQVVVGLLFLLFVITCPQSIVAAQQSSISCPNRYVTLINPVRGRDLWFDHSLKPINDQERAIAERNLAATWLLQNDAFSDNELMDTIRSFPGNQEKGVFLEVSQQLADQAKVYYPIDVPWFSPKAVFLSSYPQSSRRALIDELFNNFKDSFGYYPQSVGAWWIDSYSLNYMQEKYGIKAAMIVADQKTTDSYGVWGQWWGVAYYPSKANILTPANSLKNKENVVVTQWAQRDPALAYGSGPSISNYSLQANDYIRQGKDTQYFKNVSSAYLDCKNPIGQITVGLETGQESIDFIGEYRNQLDYIKSQPKIHPVTMSQFADKFANVYPTFPTSETIKYQNSLWKLTPQSRQNATLGDFISYDQNSAFFDYFVPDTAKFLNRDLSIKQPTKDKQFSPWYLVVIFLAGVLLYLRKQTTVWVSGLIFGVLSFGLILRSGYQFGYQVFYGPEVNLLALSQGSLIILSFFVVWLVERISKLKFFGDQRYLIFYPALGFALTQLLLTVRYTQLSGNRLIGFLADPFHLIGLSISSHSIGLINQTLPNYQAAALLKLDLNKIWQRPVLWLIVFPLLNLVLGILLGLVANKLPKKVGSVVFLVLIIFAFVYLNNQFQTDPRVAIPIS